MKLAVEPRAVRKVLGQSPRPLELQMGQRTAAVIASLSIVAASTAQLRGGVGLHSQASPGRASRGFLVQWSSRTLADRDCLILRLCALLPQRCRDNILQP